MAKLPAVIQGTTYLPLKKLIAGDMSAEVLYFNDREGFHCEQLSSIVCQGVLCTSDCDDGPPDLYIRASEMGLQVNSSHPVKNFSLILLFML